MIETKAIADLFVSARTATVNIKPNALRLRQEKQVYTAESLEKLQDAIASLGNAGAAMLSLITESMSPVVYTHRVGPAAPDVLLAGLTADSAWHQLNLGGIVPAGATAIVLHVLFTGNVADLAFAVKKNGNAGNNNISCVRCQVANQANQGDLIVGCDSNRIIEYLFNGGTYIAVTVGGWLK